MKLFGHWDWSQMRFVYLWQVLEIIDTFVFVKRRPRGLRINLFKNFVREYIISYDLIQKKILHTSVVDPTLYEVNSSLSILVEHTFSSTVVISNAVRTIMWLISGSRCIQRSRTTITPVCSNCRSIGPPHDNCTSFTTGIPRIDGFVFCYSANIPMV